MLRRALIFVAIPVLAIVATACVNPLAPPTGAAPLRYRDDLFSAVTKTPDITYGNAVDQTNANVALNLDLYQPAGDTDTHRPAVVWVHGGSFTFGDKTSPELVIEASWLAKKGYVGASINYRIAPHGCSAAAPSGECILAIVQAMQDAQTAVRFLRENAATYGIDPTRIAIGGSSAGAITALNVGYNGDAASFPGDHQGFSSSVRAAQSISGAALGTGSISPGDAPALLFHGTADPLVPYSWATDTVGIAHQKGDVALLLTWPGEGHVPFAQHVDQILNDTRNFFYTELDLAHAS